MHTIWVRAFRTERSKKVLRWKQTQSLKNIKEAVWLVVFFKLWVTLVGCDNNLVGHCIRKS